MPLQLREIETETEGNLHPRAEAWPLRSVLALPPILWCCACGVRAAPPLALPCTRSGLSLRPGHSAGAPEGWSSSTGHGSPLSSQTRRPSPSRLSLEHTARSQDATTLAIEVVSQSSHRSTQLPLPASEQPMHLSTKLPLGRGHCGLLAVRRTRRLTSSAGDTTSKPPRSCSSRAARTTEE